MPEEGVGVEPGELEGVAEPVGDGEPEGPGEVPGEGLGFGPPLALGEGEVPGEPDGPGPQGMTEFWGVPEGVEVGLQAYVLVVA